MFVYKKAYKKTYLTNLSASSKEIKMIWKKVERYFVALNFKNNSMLHKSTGIPNIQKQKIQSIYCILYINSSIDYYL